jgi:sugar (pentulose or hexulose) kinase
MEFLAIDIGSSFLKGAVLDLNTRQVRSVTRMPFPDPVTSHAPGHFEVPADEIVAAAERLLHQLLGQSPRCAGVVASTQMGGLVLADAHGRPHSHYISWRDQRTVGEGQSFARLRERLGDQRLAALGHDLKPGYMLSLLDWLSSRGERPATGLAPLSIGDFVLARLCRAQPLAHPTAACGSVAVATRQWDFPSIELLGLDQLAWPTMVELTTPVGHWLVDGRSLPCYPALGDHACALAGILLEPGELSINISTGSQVSQLTNTLLAGSYQTRPYLDQRFLNTITHIPAGRSLNVIVDLLSELARAQGQTLADPWPYIAAAAEAAESRELEQPTAQASPNALPMQASCSTQPTAPSTLSVDLSFFEGPLGNHGSITHITTENLAVGPLFLAAFRAMARNYAVLADRISPTRSWSRLVFSGGLAQNLSILRRLVRQSIPGDCRVCPETEDTLRGLLAAALVASRHCQSLAEATRQLAEDDRERMA